MLKENEFYGEDSIYIVKCEKIYVENSCIKIIGSFAKRPFTIWGKLYNK
jgi:hypothetical protein